MTSKFVEFNDNLYINVSNVLGIKVNRYTKYNIMYIDLEITTKDGQRNIINIGSCNTSDTDKIENYNDEICRFIRRLNY